MKPNCAKESNKNNSFDLFLHMGCAYLTIDFELSRHAPRYHRHGLGQVLKHFFFLYIRNCFILCVNLVKKIPILRPMLFLLLNLLMSYEVQV